MEQDFYSKTRPIIEVFNSIEGEGHQAGTPTIFVRLSGCNLRCCFANSICDTAYSSFKAKKGKYCYQDVMDIIQKYPLSETISITGGEPFLNYEIVADLINIATLHNKDVTVETNGTIQTIPQSILRQIDCVNISPKLSSSDPTIEKLKKNNLNWSSALEKHKSIRYNREALWKMIHYCKDFRLKYVVSSKEDFDEIEFQIEDIIKYDVERKGRNEFPLRDDNRKEIWRDCQFINPFNIILMPAGSTNEELNQNRKMVAEYCAEHGYTYTDRLQIVIWGTEKER